MTHNGCTCHTLNTVVRMLGSFCLEGVLLSFHSNHSFCLSLSLLSCFLVFWKVVVVSSSFFFRPTYHSSENLLIDARLSISWNLSCHLPAGWCLLFGLLPRGIDRDSISSECFFSRVRCPWCFVSSIPGFCHLFARWTRNFFILRAVAPRMWQHSLLRLVFAC